MNYLAPRRVAATPERRNPERRNEDRTMGRKKLEDAVKPIVAMEGRPLRPLSADERAICDLLSEQREWHASAVGLTRWIRQDKDARKADKAIVAAAESLWAGMLIGKDVDGNYFYTG